MARQLTPPLPPLTEANLRAAHQAMAWTTCWTFERAMADPIRSIVVECRARTLRMKQWQQQRRADRAELATWLCAQLDAPHRTDCKRAAAGDLDD